MSRKIIAFMILSAALCVLAMHAGAESVLNQMTGDAVMTADGVPSAGTEPDSGNASGIADGEKDKQIICMMPLERPYYRKVAKEGPCSQRQMQFPKESLEEGAVLRMLPLFTAAPGEPEATASPLPEQLSETPVFAASETPASTVSETPIPAAAEAPDSKGMWISGPEKMRAGTKKYYKAVFDEEKPRKYKVSWSLDCDPDTARVYRNGQVWVRPKASAGTVLTLKCHVEGKDRQGQLWTAETTMEITVKE
ncbi:MAG: hypothetical protein IKD50_02530 [Clostridia bacterium]|nr:hypothetical protein [Clostridia bacterium]